MYTVRVTAVGAGNEQGSYTLQSQAGSVQLMPVQMPGADHHLRPPLDCTPPEFLRPKGLAHQHRAGLEPAPANTPTHLNAIIFHGLDNTPPSADMYN